MIHPREMSFFWRLSWLHEHFIFIYISIASTSEKILRLKWKCHVYLSLPSPLAQVRFNGNQLSFNDYRNLCR